MFQKTADDTSHMNIFRLAGNLWNQTADSTDHHIDPYTGTGGFHQFLHDFLIRKRIHLQSNVGRFSCSGMCNLFINHIQNFILQAFRSHQQMIHMFDRLSHGKSLEYISCFQSDIYIISHQRQIRIKP